MTRNPAWARIPRPSAQPSRHRAAAAAMSSGRAARRTGYGHPRRRSRTVGPAAEVARLSTAGDAPLQLEDRVNGIRLALPDAYQEHAWVGTRWRVRTRTFAHVYTAGRERPAASVKPAALAGPGCVVTFRSPSEGSGALVGSGFPYFRADRGRDVVGMVLSERTDWTEVAELGRGSGGGGRSAAAQPGQR